MPKRYNTPHRSRVVKTRLSEEEYADFTARLAPYGISQSEFLRQAIRRTAMRPIIHNVNGKISDERFMELSADYEQEQRELKDRAAALQAELDKSQAATVNAEKFMGIVRKHLAFEELTPTLLRR